MNRVLCIWLPEWPIQRLHVARPELNAAPLVLHARDPRRRAQRVVACCERARRRGVLVGMPLAEAAALGEAGAGDRGFPETARAERGRPSPGPRSGKRRACPAGGSTRQTAMELHEHQGEHDRAALAELAVWCEQFSPIVGLEEGDAPACLLLDVTGLGPLFGNEHRLAESIVDAFRRRGYQVRLGVADTVGAAWALARYGASPRGPAPRGPAPRGPSSLSEKDACPSGEAIVVAPPGPSRAVLEPLPVEALRLPAETLQTLRQLGVGTLLQLWQLPRRGLAARLGKVLIQRIDQALGTQPEVIVAHRPPPEFTAEWLLEHPTDRRDALETIFSHLAEQVAGCLVKSGHAAVRVEAWLEGQTTSRRFQVGLFQPTTNPQHLEDLLRLQLETLQMRQPVQRVRLTSVTTVRITGQQHALWEGAGKDGQRELAWLVDRLSSRLGKEHVLGVQVQAGALPERAYREQPLIDIKARAPRQGGRASGVSVHRPLWLQEPPQSLEMVSVAADGPAGDGPPIFFRFQNVRHDVARHWGPERIETDWWRGRSVRRDYYRVETTAGFRFWLFRRLSDNAWFLHGCFE